MEDGKDESDGKLNKETSDLLVYESIYLPSGKSTHANTKSSPKMQKGRV